MVFDLERMREVAGDERLTHKLAGGEQEKGFVRALVAFRSRAYDAAVEIIQALDGLREIHRGVLDEIPVSGKLKEPRHRQGVQARGYPAQMVENLTVNEREWRRIQRIGSIHSAGKQ